MKKGLEDRLRQLEIGEPDPTLKKKALDAVSACLTQTGKPFSWRDRLAVWRAEILLAGGTAVVALLLLTLNGAADPILPVTVRIDEAAVQALVEELELNAEMESRYRSRLDWARKGLAATRRFGHDERIID